MKTFTYCTRSHQQLLEDWLIPSLPKDLELVCITGEQDCSTGEFLASGWNATMRKKVQLILQAIEQTWGDAFFFVDADIQFFGNVSHILREKLSKHEIVAQDDSFREHAPGSRLCAGLFACQSTHKTQQFWQSVLNVMDENPKMHDQDAMNLVRQSTDIRMAALPTDLFWSHRKMWQSDQELHPPQRIVAHHANFTIGIEQKQSQLSAVRKIVKQRQGREFHGSKYGGYFILSQYLNKDSIVYSVGIGEDASFDLSLIEKYGVQVHGFDPTPRSIQWAKRHLHDRANFFFHPFGILNHNGVAKHFIPNNPEWVSCSLHMISDNAIEFPVRRLVDTMNELGHADIDIDILKLDIEGAECLVVDDMLSCNILPRQLLVEIHDQWIDSQAIKRTFSVLQDKGYKCFAKFRKDYCFVKP